MKEYDYLIVGSGLYGAVFARRATDAGYRCLVIEKRPQRGGNLYCEEVSTPLSLSTVLPMRRWRIIGGRFTTCLSI